MPYRKRVSLRSDFFVFILVVPSSWLLLFWLLPPFLFFSSLFDGCEVLDDDCVVKRIYKRCQRGGADVRARGLRLRLLVVGLLRCWTFIGETRIDEFRITES